MKFALRHIDLGSREASRLPISLRRLPYRLRTYVVAVSIVLLCGALQPGDVRASCGFRDCWPHQYCSCGYYVDYEYWWFDEECNISCTAGTCYFYG